MHAPAPKKLSRPDESLNIACKPHDTHGRLEYEMQHEQPRGLPVPDKTEARAERKMIQKDKQHNQYSKSLNK